MPVKAPVVPPAPCYGPGPSASSPHLACLVPSVAARCTHVACQARAFGQHGACAPTPPAPGSAVGQARTAAPPQTQDFRGTAQTGFYPECPPRDAQFSPSVAS